MMPVVDEQRELDVAREIDPAESEANVIPTLTEELPAEELSLPTAEQPLSIEEPTLPTEEQSLPATPVTEAPDFFEEA